MTDNSNIIQMPEPLDKIAKRIREAYERAQLGRREWIEGTIELAIDLAEARHRFKSDREFSHWLVDAELENIGHQDRAALINMATNIGLARIILEESQRNSWRLIWTEEMQYRFTSAGKPHDGAPIIQIPVQTAPESAISPNDAAKTAITIPVKEPERKKIDGKHSFRGWPRAEEVAAIYQNRNVYSRIGAALNKKGGAKIWDLILQAMDAGFLTTNSICPNEINLGILFPNAPQRFRGSRLLIDKNDLKVVTDQIMPAAIANRNAILADPDNIESIIRDHAVRLRDAAMAEQYAKKIQAAKATMKADEHEVVIFGKTFWPIFDWDPELAYDYETLRVAVWTFRELHLMARSTSDPSPRSSALHIRYSIKFLWRCADKQMRKILHLITDLTRALEANPNGHLDPGERLPTMPVDREPD